MEPIGPGPAAIGGWWWASWHDIERVEGLAPTRHDAIGALDHHLSGRRRAGRALMELAEPVRAAAGD